MNYSVIQSARDGFGKYESDYKELSKSVNLSLFTIARSNLNSTEKKKVWKGLSQRAKNIIEKAEKVVNNLNSVRFAEEEGILGEERDAIIREYISLIGELRRERETITRQIERDTIPVNSLQQKEPKEGYCYFCDIKISSGVPYRLSKEEQKVLEIEIAEGAGFCSQDCLLSHCKEHKSREKLRQQEEIKNKEKIENGRRMVTQIQLLTSELTSKVNKLEKWEKDLELKIRFSPSEKKVGFFRRIAQNLGLAKRDDPYVELGKIKREKSKLETELEKKNEELQTVLVNLSIDEQVWKERENSKKKVSSKQRNNIGTKGE